MKTFDEILTAVEDQPLRKVAVAVAQDPSVVEAAAEARKRNIAEPVLVGDEGEIRQAPEAKAIVKKPVAVYIEKVYEEGSFAGLGIGT